VSLADILVAAHHALVRDILLHLALQVHLDLQPTQQIHPLRLLSWQRRGRRFELGEVRPRTWERLRGGARDKCCGYTGVRKCGGRYGTVEVGQRMLEGA